MTRRTQGAAPPLGQPEHEALATVADALVGGDSSVPAPSELPEYGAWVERALAARSDAREAVVSAAGELARLRGEELRGALRELSASEPELFHALSSVLAGAYLLVPEVAQAVGYPGQERAPAAFDQAADELETGILDPVIERGAIHRTC